MLFMNFKLPFRWKFYHDGKFYESLKGMFEPIVRICGPLQKFVEICRSRKTHKMARALVGVPQI
jgi:hypothetical protein